MTFKLSKEQSAKRQALAADLRAKAAVLNIAIAAFNREVEPLSTAVAEAQAGYNETLEMARALANGVAETAREEFDARSDRWQDGETGTQVRSWIEQWEMSLDEVDRPKRWRNLTLTPTLTNSKTLPSASWNWSI